MNIKSIFLDVGGVILTNGWDHQLRSQIIAQFSLEEKEFQERHLLLFDSLERGKLSFDQYLHKVIFYKKRNFTLEEVKRAIFESAAPYQEMIDLCKEIKEKYQLKMVMVSNENRELALDRIKRFGLTSWIDCFVVSSFVGVRKPDPVIYHLALELVQIKKEEVLYIDDRSFLIEMAQELGIQGIVHKTVATTKEKLENFFKFKIIE